MRELSLNVMDIAQNSISAQASLIEIELLENTFTNTLLVTVRDNGCGMSEKQVRDVQNPFYTTRTTRKVGLGIPLYKMACEQTGGVFTIESTPGIGTTVTALFHTDHIDMTPVGNMAETVWLLIVANPALDFIFTREVDSRSFTIDTRSLREILGEDISLSQTDVSDWIRDYLNEAQSTLDNPDTP